MSNTSSTSSDTANDSKDTNASQDSTPSNIQFNQDISNSEEIKKTEPIKNKVQILYLKDQIESKKMEAAVSTVLNVSNVKDIFKAKTEKEKIKEAKQVLLELSQRMARRKILKSGDDDGTGSIFIQVVH